MAVANISHTALQVATTRREGWQIYHASSADPNTVMPITLGYYSAVTYIRITGPF
jgi:hypothetical protein